ncbi:MAG: hypothetical protein KDB14_00550 [Planctomycetales bacterium]|nr:hypothetical protein [Planctomycetales bacterium]
MAEIPDNSEATGDNSPDDLSDQTLLRRFQSGEQDAATALYLRYAKRLQQLAKAQTADELAVRVDPEDVVQSVFRTFFRRAAEGHYEIPDGEELWKLFLVIALNKVRRIGQFHRAAKRNIASTRQFQQQSEAGTSDKSADDQAFMVLRMTVDDLLKQQSESQREIIMLRIEGHDIGTIAEWTGRAKRTVERVLQQFRETMSQMLQEE